MSAGSQIAAGGTITAAMIRGIAPLAAFKPSDENRTSNTTVSNDAALFLSNLAASAQYFIVCYLNYEGGTVNVSDLKWTWSVPSAATMRYHAQFLSVAGTPTVQVGVTHAGADVVSASTNGSGNLRAVSMQGTLQMATTPGSLQLQWAQNTSSATSTIMHAQSSIVAWQVG